MRLGAALALLLACPAQASETASFVDIPRLDSAPSLDGVLDDPAWSKAARVGAPSSERGRVLSAQGAARVGGLMQFQPKEGVPMSEETAAFLGLESCVTASFGELRDVLRRWFPVKPTR
ncbi:MAG: hypothetical protein HY719_08250 [Planctomycetes bacterium]|nr:hypothetical protein [Planctomycetota bacterium]